ncbi:hypothetical protein GCM10023315_19480 [Algibacter aquimarinus]|uniref:Uncharacterized protein n=1 Tax=Algibacter aquimarinus TaxID=1136748 RepID=A0ABP9HFI0_9FLAO
MLITINMLNYIFDSISFLIVKYKGLIANQPKKQVNYLPVFLYKFVSIVYFKLPTISSGFTQAS